MTTLKDRLKLAMDGPPKVSQADLARACKIKPPSVNNWVSGRTQVIEGPNLLAAAARLGVNPQWLATGRGPMRLNDSAQQTLNKPSGDAEPPSQPATLTRDILHEALTLLAHDEGRGGPYGPRTRTARLYDLLTRVIADGGRLTDEHNAKFEEEVQAREQGAKKHGNELAKRRSAAARKRG